MQTCQTCRFYVAENDEEGKCHRRAPSMATTFGHYPPTVATQWCGEYETRYATIVSEWRCEKCDIGMEMPLSVTKLMCPLCHKPMSETGLIGLTPLK